jgi:uncharacterized protein
MPSGRAARVLDAGCACRAIGDDDAVTIDVLWAAWDGRGLEHLQLTTTDSIVRADSAILAVDDAGRPFRARYVIDCDHEWRVSRARIEVLAEPVRTLDLRTDGQGRWMDAASHRPLPLDGCVDIDIYPSPFTNTLAIQRHFTIAAGLAVTIDVAWVALPELTIHRVPQEYTLLERRPDGTRWRFRALDSGFTAELEIDGHGLVRDYPEIARRVL